MKNNGNYSSKSLTSEYLIAMAELNDLGSEEPDDDLFLPMKTESIYKAKSALDEVLSFYEMESTATEHGIVIHEAKSIGPVLANELIGALLDVSVKQLGQTLAGGGNAQDMIDRDGDGYIFDGTPQEQRVPYKRRDGKPVGGGAPSGMEKRRREFVRQEAARQGVQLNRERRAGGPGRSQSERKFRTETRARFDRIAREDGGFIPADRIEEGDKRIFENRMGDLNAARRPDPRDGSFDRNEERRQRGMEPPSSWDRNEERRQEAMRPEDTSFQENESRRQGGMRPQRPVDRLVGAGGPGYDESFQDNESRRQGGMRPADTSSQRAESARQGAARPQRPVDRLSGAGGPGYDESFQDNESRRQGGMRPADTSSQRAESARQGIARPQRPVDRLPGAGGPGYDESSNRAERSRMERGRPADTSSERNEARRQGTARPNRPVDRLRGAGGPSYDESSSRAESSRMNRSRPEDRSSQRAEDSRQSGMRPTPRQGRPVDRLPGSGNARADGSSNRSESNRMNRSRPADNSSQRSESARQNRASSGSRNASKRPPDRIETPGNRSRRFPRGANDYYFGGN